MIASQLESLEYNLLAGVPLPVPARFGVQFVGMGWERWWESLATPWGEATDDHYCKQNRSENLTVVTLVIAKILQNSPES